MRSIEDSVRRLPVIAAALAVAACARKEEPLAADAAATDRLETATFALG